MAHGERAVVRLCNVGLEITHQDKNYRSGKII